MSEYYSIIAPVETTLKVKNSIFMALLRAVESRQQAEARLAERRRQYHDASHHCYAFRVGFGEPLIAKSGDDGEPAGTGGRPILQALERRQLTNILAVVTRYFGGTKLGTGGLIRAYAGATQAAIDLAALVPAFQKQTLRLCYAYPQLATVQKILHFLEARPLRENFGAEVEQFIEIRAERTEEARRLLREACAGKILIETTVFA
jgi:uncharacterized YigZ family protein